MGQAKALPYLTAVPEWGHPPITPEGATIRVPAFAFRNLPELGAWLGKSHRLSPRAYEFVQPQFDCLSEKLGQLLYLKTVSFHRSDREPLENR